MRVTAIHAASDEIHGGSTAKDPNIAAICWLTHEVRTASYARYLNATLYNIHYLSNRSVYIAPFKYIPQCVKTWVVLAKQKPDLVYVMNPPIFAVLSVYLYCCSTQTQFIMDTHSPSLYSRRWRWTLPLQRWLAKHAMINIVDQDRFANLFASWGAETIVLERPPLDLQNAMLRAKSESRDLVSREGALSSKGQSSHNPNSFHITLIGQFASDEPVDVVVDAARHLPDVTFSILGERFHAPRNLIQSAPKNVIFEGYLRGHAYWDHLASADAIMTLTTFEYSLLGGAQEGMAMGKPLILSKQPVLTEYFSKGTVFVEHNVESMVEGIHEARCNREDLAKEVTALGIEKRQQWDASFASLMQLIKASFERRTRTRYTENDVAEP